MSELGKRVRDLRTEAGISSTELAKHTGVSRTYLSEIEHGHATNIALSVAVAIADFFGVRVDYLIGRSEHEASNVDR